MDKPGPRLQRPPPESWLHANGLRMNYLDWGIPPGRSEPATPTVVLALHGLASSCHWYDLVLPHLVDSYHCIALDQRGHAKTDQPSAGYDWRTLSTDVVQALDTLGVQRAVVMGHSWGGYVALSVAAIYPERVSHLVMVDGGFLDWTRWPGATWEWFKDLLRPRDVAGTRAQFLDRLRTQMAGCWSDQLAEIAMTMVRAGPDDTVRDILEPASHAQVLEAMWNEPPSTMFHRVRCPPDNGGRHASRHGQSRVRPDAQDHGRVGSVGHRKLQAGLDPRHDPRHRLPQARGDGPRGPRLSLCVRGPLANPMCGY